MYRESNATGRASGEAFGRPHSLRGDSPPNSGPVDVRVLLPG
jgi:hypothetical protein